MSVRQETIFCHWVYLCGKFMHKRVGFRIIMFRLLAVLAMLSAWVNGAHSSPNDSVKVLPDSSNFVTASLLVVSPADEFYSSLGHCAIRMECPVKDLDVCFTMQTETSGFKDFLKFLLGINKTSIVPVDAEVFLKNYRDEKRGVWQYKLNLTHSEKKELWRKLENEVMQGNYRSFTLKNNCVSHTLLTVESALQREDLDFGNLPEVFSHDNGELMRSYLKNMPWAEFFLFTISGTEIEKTYDEDVRFSPEMIGEVMLQAKIVNLEDGSIRPAVIEGKQELSKQQTKVSNSSIKPMMVFGFLLLIVLIVTFCEWVFGWNKLGLVTDEVLFTIQSVLGVLLPLVVIMTGLVDVYWNWYFIPLNPLPLIIYLCFRKREWFGKVYLLYALVLVAFICLTPFFSQLDWYHQLITGMFTVRCVSKYFKLKK